MTGRVLIFRNVFRPSSILCIRKLCLLMLFVTRLVTTKLIRIQNHTTYYILHMWSFSCWPLECFAKWDHHVLLRDVHLLLLGENSSSRGWYGYYMLITDYLTTIRHQFRHQNNILSYLRLLDLCVTLMYPVPPGSTWWTVEASTSRSSNSGPHLRTRFAHVYPA